MNNRLYDALENSLQALEQGQKMDAVLARHPDLARELRPLLETSLRARKMSVLPVPGDVQRRGRARLLRRASELRQGRRLRPRAVIPVFSRAAITLGLVGILALTSTGLVSASSSSLPGDQLYSVKRTWEGVRLLFVFSPQEHDVLQSQYDQERLDEIDELLTEKRSAPISFSGLVTKQQDGHWMISGIPVQVVASTRLPADAINDGAPVMIIGLTREDGTVEAQEIQLLLPGVSLPPFEPSDNGNGNEGEDSNPIPTKILSIPGSGPNGTGQEHHPYQFSGVVESMMDGLWSINGQPVSVEQAEINGNVKVGSYVKFEGYYDSNGQFIVTKIEIKSSGDSNSSNEKNGNGSGGGDSSGDGGGGDNGGGDETPHP